MKLRADTVFYRIGQWIWIPFVITGIWFSQYGYERYHGLLECSFMKMSGFPCPGCGGTRALLYLFSGDIVKSFQYHPVVLYGVLAYIHFMGLYFFRHHGRKKDAPVREIQIDGYLYIAITVILIQWIVKIALILL